MNALKSIKDFLYRLLVEKNDNIRRDYQSVINANPVFHKNHRLLSWLRLIRLNFKYRVFHRRPAALTSRKTQSNRDKPKRDINSMSESEFYLRKPAEHFVLDLLKYDIVSFDIFDTLILRPFSRPSDLFMLLSGYYKNVDFYKLRVKAEADVRKWNLLNKGSKETTIFEIYQRIERYSGIDAVSGAKLEFELECKLCYANPYMQTIFNMLKTNNRKIIAVSNMYLPRDMMARLLKICGYTGFEDIFVSCDYQAGKEDGALFAIADEKIAKGHSVIHVGDNEKTDFNPAKQCGWDAYLYPAVNELGSKKRDAGMSPLIGSAYKGIVHGRLFNGLYKYDPLYEFGFIYGGLFVTGFCHWIHRYCEENRIDKILFLARDGDTLKKVYDMLYSDIPSEYVYFSRKASLRPAIETQRYSYIESELLLKMYSPHCKYTAAQCLELIQAGFLMPELESYGLTSFQPLGRENAQACERFLEMILDYMDEIIASAKDENEAAKQYFSSVIQDSKRAAVVDIGWRGSGYMAIKTLVEDQWGMSCRVYGLMAAMCKPEPECCISQLMDESISAYMFSPMFNRHAYVKYKQDIKKKVAITELFLGAKHAPLEGFRLNDNGRFQLEFGVPDVENYMYSERISQGIVDFATEYHKRFSSFPMMRSIFGADVSAPILQILDNHERLKLYFNGYAFNPQMGAAFDSLHMESLLDFVGLPITGR